MVEECSSIVNKIIYVFWTGDNELTHNRKICLNHLKEITECNIVLVTKDNLHEYILPEAPLHEGYKYLSLTHRADYLRTYFMHFHGGGYTDIKIPTGSWKKAFDDIIENKNIYINGYPELPQYNLDGYIGNCAYIARPNSEFTREWYNKLIHKMDEKIPLFNKSGYTPTPAQQFDENYPIHWEEILGDIFRSVLPKYIGKNILYSVPKPNFDFWYR